MSGWSDSILHPTKTVLFCSFSSTHIHLKLSSLLCRIIVLQKYTVCFREEARLVSALRNGSNLRLEGRWQGWVLTEGGSRAVAARLCLTGLTLFTSTGGLRVLSHRPPVHRAAHGEAEDGFVQRVRPRCRLGLELRVGGACASPQSWGAGVCHAALKLGALAQQHAPAAPGEGICCCNLVVIEIFLLFDRGMAVSGALKECVHGSAMSVTVFSVVAGTTSPLCCRR